MSSKFPVPPGVVARIVETAADPEASVADLAKLLEKDAVLSAQVLKTVNSPFYGLRRRVASVELAVGLLGMRAVRNLVLSLGVRDLVPANAVGGFPIGAFWESSLRRAAAAQCIGEQMERSDAGEFFTLGLCLDIGTLLRIKDDEEFGARLAEVMREPGEVRLALEEETGTGHDELGFSMFYEWRFPEELTVPIRYHHKPDDTPEEYRLRAQVAHAAEALADLSTVIDKQATMLKITERLAVLGIEDGAISSLVDRVNDLVTEFAELLGLTVDNQPTFQEIIAMASQGLATLNLSYEETTRRLENALVEQQRMAVELEKLNDTLTSQALTDPLTGLANRRLFDDTLRREIAEAQRQKSPLTLLLLDVDHFKNLNDTYGHQAGDYVLEQLARRLKSELRTNDTVARIGGEEFAAVLPFTDEAGGKNVAERLRRGLATMSLQWDGQVVSCTASIGGATVPEIVTADETIRKLMLQQADLALYDAKETGRNKVSWEFVGTTEPSGVS